MKMEALVQHPTPVCVQLDGLVQTVQQVFSHISSNKLSFWNLMDVTV